MSSTKMFTLDKFLGVNEAVDGITEMALGEASRIINCNITNGYNLTTRPGIARLAEGTREPAPILAMWSGYSGDDEILVIVDWYNGQDRIVTYTGMTAEKVSGVLGIDSQETGYVKVFSYAGLVYIMSAKNIVCLKNGKWTPADIYIPTVGFSTAPSGGGGEGESINLLSNKRRIEFSADGESTAFVFTDDALILTRLEIDNVEQSLATMGTWSPETHTYTFNSPPIKGVSNVIFDYEGDEALTAQARLTLAKCRFTENYNGATDTRLFLGGDGTNICYYSGVPASGDLTKLYFPALNEVAVDMSGSPVTGLIRHYGKLLVFKPDGVFAITYQPVTLEGGTVIAGFYLRSVSKGVGSSVMGQLQTVDNYPRSIDGASVYEWRLESTGYRDERNYRVVSERVQRTLARADSQHIVTCDDSADGTYYVCCNDNDGTVLVNRYLLGKKPGIWTVYKSNLFKNVTHALMYNGIPIFAHNGDIFKLEPDTAADAPEIAGQDSTAIKTVWESGFMSFGADWLRKYSSLIYVSIKPQSYCELGITAETDRRSEYLTKYVSESLFSFANLSFPTFTFKSIANPQIHRVRLKVKKFVYYKLVLKSDVKNSKCTVLGIDQQVRFSSMAK